MRLAVPFAIFASLAVAVGAFSVLLHRGDGCGMRGAVEELLDGVDDDDDLSMKARIGPPNRAAVVVGRPAE